MKKIILIVVGLVVIGGGVAYFVINSGNDNKSTTSNKSASATTSSKTSTTYKVVKACDALTPEVAKTVLGDTAQPGSSDANNHETSTTDVTVTNCTYTAGVPSAQNISTLVSAGILARSAKTKTGADSNAAQFTSSGSATHQAVSGYGDAAYWNSAYGQFNILKHNNWYILSTGTNNPATRTLDAAKLYADAIIDNL